MTQIVCGFCGGEPLRKSSVKRGKIRVRFYCKKCCWKYLEVYDLKGKRLTTRTPKRLQVYARQNRRKPTSAEKEFFKCLQRARIRFKTQQPVGNFIVDFMLKDRKVIVEIDGGYHASRVDYDLRRTEFLESVGYRVLRLKNEEVGGLKMHEMLKGLGLR